MNTIKQSILYLRHDSPSLGPLFRRLANIRHWNRMLAESLSPEDQPLLQHCHVVHADETGLMILVDSPHWATRLRFLTPGLIGRLKQKTGMEQLTSIHCKISPQGGGKPFHAKRKVKKLSLSDRNATLLMQAADTVRHTALKTALKKIASKKA